MPAGGGCMTRLYCPPPCGPFLRRPGTLCAVTDFDALARAIKDWGRELGFQKVGIAGVDLAADELRLEGWLAQGRHGSMQYMQRHGTRRTRPAELVPGTLRVVSARMDYRVP